MWPSKICIDFSFKVKEQLFEQTFCHLIFPVHCKASWLWCAVEKFESSLNIGDRVHELPFPSRQTVIYLFIYAIPCCWCFKGSVERSLLPWANFLIFTRNRPESLKITSARCFLLKCQRKDSKKAKEHRQFHGVLGRWRTAAIDRTTFRVCQRCRKTAVLAVFSRLWGVISRGKAFRDQQCQFLTRNKSLRSENESNCSMTSKCVRSDSILPPRRRPRAQLR